MKNMLGPQPGDPGFRFFSGQPFRLYMGGLSKTEARRVAGRLSVTNYVRVVPGKRGKWTVYRSFWDRRGYH